MSFSSERIGMDISKLKVILVGDRAVTPSLLQNGSEIFSDRQLVTSFNRGLKPGESARIERPFRNISNNSIGVVLESDALFEEFEEPDIANAMERLYLMRNEFFKASASLGEPTLVIEQTRRSYSVPAELLPLRARMDSITRINGAYLKDRVSILELRDVAPLLAAQRMERLRVLAHALGVEGQQFFSHSLEEILLELGLIEPTYKVPHSRQALP